MVFIPWIFHQCAQNSGGVMIVLFFLETGMVIVSRRNRNYSSIIELYIGAEIFCKCGFRKGVLHVFFSYRLIVCVGYLWRPIWPEFRIFLSSFCCGCTTRQKTIHIWLRLIKFEFFLLIPPRFLYRSHQLSSNLQVRYHQRSISVQARSHQPSINGQKRSHQRSINV